MAAPILLVSELFPPAVGGSAVLFANVYSRLEAPVTVLTDTAPAHATTYAGLPVIEGPLQTPWWGLTHPRGALHHARTAMTIRAQARRLGPGTVVHCGRVLPEGVAARLARLAGGPPYVCWLHGEDLATALTSRELTAVTGWVLRGAAAAIANSHNTRDALAPFGTGLAPTTVVHPGVDLARFTPHLDGSAVRAQLGLEADDCLLLSVGRLQARKGHDVAIRALARLLPELPGLIYAIAGSGEERERLEALAASLGVTSRVRFVGVVPDSALPTWYAASDVFLLPNRIEAGDFEGFGIVFLEAAACARPVVGGRSGGVVEAVDDGRTGLLVDGADVEAVAHAIGRFARSRELRAEFGRRGRAWAEGFGWEAAAAGVARLHDTLSPG